MNELKKCNLLLLYAPLPTIDNEAETEKQQPWSKTSKYERMAKEFDNLFNDKFPEADFFRIGPGVFLVDEDACYPAVRAFMNLCEGYKLPYLLLPLSDSVPSSSLEYPKLPNWLTGKGKSCRLTQYAKPEPEKKP